MSYKSLARRYRPKTFSEVVGQDLVISALQGGLKNGILPHALIFSGPRGTGKTTLCRILAKALNCLNPIQGFEPCLECESCIALRDNVAFGYLEVDGASFNGVDMIREIISTFASIPPRPFKAKVYVIDEAHMLSNAAFNAMLKTIEEPPDTAYIALVTTEPHKIPETVKSRCVHFELEPVSNSVILSQLKKVAEAERLNVPESVLFEISTLARNSVRDGLTLLDRYVLLSLSGSTEQFEKWVFKTKDQRYVELLDCCLSLNPEKAVSLFRELVNEIVDADLVIRSIAELFNEYLIFFSTNSASDQKFENLKIKHVNLSVYDIIDITLAVLRYSDLALRSAFKQQVFEAGLIKICNRVPIIDIQEALAKLGEIKKSGKPQVREEIKPQASMPLSDNFTVESLRPWIEANIPSSFTFLNKVQFSMRSSKNQFFLTVSGGSFGISMAKKHQSSLKKGLRELWPNFDVYHIEFVEQDDDEETSENRKNSDFEESVKNSGSDQFVEDFARRLLQKAELLK
ncbi:MAG: DNA polymerase III subunit gamma/tau [Deltaproteobacteria bacterium]|nr:DNA polymerase III subunit gamma/tau [Deltaproteobacteria bacterium]